jgi:hypothetical protein
MNTYKSMASLLFVLTFASYACTDKYDEYNVIQSGATEEETDRDGYRLRSFMLTMQSWVIPTDANAAQFIECLLGGSFGGYLSDSNAGFNNRNFSTYVPEEHWIQVAFNDVIPKIITNNSNIKNATNDPVFIAVADVIKVAAISRITDVYGPIPYSKVGEEGKLAAPFDSQEDVYNKMFEELDKAIEALTIHRTENFTPKADRVYGGNVEKWVKLANSLKLRLALRISNVRPDLAKIKAEEAANHTIGPMTQNADNAFITVTNTNPFRVAMHEWNSGDSRISADITSYMNGYGDPRRDRYFTKSTFTDESVTNGFIGMRSGIMIPDVPGIKLYSNMKVNPDTKLLWMNAAEVAFLKAEGALRLWNMGGTAEELYNTAIALSFDQWGVSGAALYMADKTSKPQAYQDPLGSNSYSGTISDMTIKWDSSVDFEKNLERIITQKWIANFPLGIEAWSEFRRTGYPKLMQVARNNSGGTVDTERMARRLPFPQEEYLENAENVAIAVDQYLKGPDNMGTDVWWAKKN